MTDPQTGSGEPEKTGDCGSGSNTIELHWDKSTILTFGSCLPESEDESGCEPCLEEAMSFVEEGFYWHRPTDHRLYQYRWRVVEVFQHEGGWWMATDINDLTTWDNVENHQGEWQGPIPKPSSDGP